MTHATPLHDPEAPCAAYAALAGDIAADAVDAVTVARVEAHAAACERCRNALDAALRYQRAMRRVGANARVSDALRERVLGILRDERESRSG